MTILIIIIAVVVLLVFWYFSKYNKLITLRNRKDDQFSQIVMLPQGEFRKLLTSQSENKEAILRKIFKTDRYGKMTKIVEAKKQKAESDARAAKAMRDSYFEQIAGALPLRMSELFTAIEGNANIYQIQEALVSEQEFYAEQKADHFIHYEQAKKVIGD